MSTKIESYYEWQYPVFAPQSNAKPGKKYHVKLMAAVDFGDAFGLAVNIEVLPGVSKQATNFKTNNGLVYREPPQAVHEASQASGASLKLGTTTVITTNQIH